jgi:Fuc2NAc and GlcNAc transferase
MQNYYPFIILILTILLLGVELLRHFESYAINKNILAIPGTRTLHKTQTPRGGGIVFSLLFVSGVVILYLIEIINFNVLMVLGLGAFMASIFGFTDDIVDISASYKLAMQFFLAIWAIYWLDPVILTNWIPYWLSLSAITLFLVWMLNLYNFMDGVDGMASTSGLFFCLVLTLILLYEGHPQTAILFLILAASLGGFIFFNWPPASIFMGDSGSLFLGYTFGSLLIFTVITGSLTIWTWLIVFGYFFSDTMVTQIARIIIVKKWYAAHRSHAYQNLARISGSHFKVTIGVTTFHLIWILPLAFWSVLQPDFALIAVVLALLPAVIFAYLYGPLFSSS